jgi:hypothetical protein
MRVTGLSVHLRVVVVLSDEDEDEDEGWPLDFTRPRWPVRLTDPFTLLGHRHFAIPRRSGFLRFTLTHHLHPALHLILVELRHELCVTEM